MSDRFKYPNQPLNWAANPIDYDLAVADVPYMGTRTAETTQRYVLGTRKLFWDGRVYKYGYASGNCYCGQGVQNFTAAFIADDGATHPAATTVAGATLFTIATQTAAEDILAGGYVVAYTTAETKTTFRGIVGNSYAAGTTMTLYVDEPISQVLTKDSTDLCAYYSPYYGVLTYGSGTHGSIMGVAAEYAVSTEYFWLQTWGPTRVTPGEAGYGAAAHERQMVFSEIGAIWSHSAARATTLQSQHAGFIIPLTSGGDDMPLLMLQISI